MNVSGGGGRGPSQDFDLNLAPIIDCFTVLITFMLVSASFISIGILDAGAGAAGQTASKDAPPPIIVQLELKEQFGMEIQLSGKATDKITLPAAQGDWDFVGLTRELTNIKTKWPQSDSVILSAANDIEYIHVIKIMEKLRKLTPAVLLGGF
ncbi:MAG: biopolymer transporter ExbD [Bdellovibrionia bacterium]